MLIWPFAIPIRKVIRVSIDLPHQRFGVRPGKGWPEFKSGHRSRLRELRFRNALSALMALMAVFHPFRP
jgi:hypothetical protein